MAEVSVSARIRWQIFRLKQEREVRCSQDGGAILVRLREGGRVALEDMPDFGDIPAEEQHKVILGAASLGDKKPKLEELYVQPFPAGGAVRKLDYTWVWRDESDRGYTIGPRKYVVRIDLTGTPLKPRELTARHAPPSKWRRVIASFRCDRVYGPVSGAPLSAALLCRVDSDCQVGLVVESDLGLIAVGVGVKRRADGTFNLSPGQPYERPLLVTLGAEGKPRVFHRPT